MEKIKLMNKIDNSIQTTRKFNFFKLKLAYILSDSPYNVRAAKILPLLAKLFQEVHFIGCSRGKVWTGDDAIAKVQYHNEERVLAHGAKSIFGSVGFLNHVREMLNIIRPDLVIATNEEYVIPFVLGYFPKPRFLICDLTDSLSIRMMGPLRHFNFFWQILSNFSKKNLDGMIEMTEQRLNRHKVRPLHSVVIYNSPKWKNVEKMPDLPTPSIYVCGSILDRLSGVETLLNAVERKAELNIIFAGRPVGSWMSKQFINHPKVTNLGEITSDQSLRVAKSCCAIFAHYKPSIPNYLYAAPNKFYDAMMLGIPLLINNECLISETACRLGIGITSPFGDIDRLDKAIELVLNQSEFLKDGCKRAQDAFQKLYSWDLMEHRWIDLFNRIVQQTET